MPKERLFQLHLEGGAPVEVTPRYFRGLRYRPREVEPIQRCVREVEERYQVQSPAHAAAYLMTEVYHPFDAFPQEELCILLLDTRNHLTHEVMLYRGTVNATGVRVAEIFREAVRHNAVSIVVAHNHPSGDPEPSPEDIHVTANMRRAGELLDIALLDHIVIGNSNWVSLKEKGYGFG